MKHFVRETRAGDFAVIFAAQRTDSDGEAYGVMAERMVTLARQQPGFIGMESVRGEDGFGLTVSYWESEAAIHRWKAHAEHLEAQRRGRENWYSSFDLRVCRIERSHGSIRSSDSAPCPQS